MALSETPEQHIWNSRKVWSFPRKASATLKLKTYSFITDSTDFISRVVHSGWTELAFQTTDAIHGLQPPNSITELRSFSRLCNVFLRFIFYSTRIAALLNQSLGEGLLVTFLPLQSKELDDKDDSQGNLCHHRSKRYCSLVATWRLKRMHKTLKSTAISCKIAWRHDQIYWLLTSVAQKPQRTVQYSGKKVSSNSVVRSVPSPIPWWKLFYDTHWWWSSPMNLYCYGLHWATRAVAPKTLRISVWWRTTCWHYRSSS